MPRRARKGSAQESTTTKAGSAANEQAISTRIQSIYKKIIVALQDQRDLRCDLSSTRTRALLLDSEYVVLHSEYEKSLAAHNKLEALSKELARQNKTIDEESERRIAQERKMREDIVHRFNIAMMDINKKLARQSTTREQRDIYVSNMQSKVSDLRERHDMREQHFKQQALRKKLEEQLACAKQRDLSEKHLTISKRLQLLQTNLREARAEYDTLSDQLTDYRAHIRNGENMLDETEANHASQKARILRQQAEVKQMQALNVTNRKANDATNVRLKAIDAEYTRLENAISEARDVERKERAKVDALEKLCRQVTCERTELHSEIVVMQEAWTKLKQEIDALKDQVGDSGKVFDVLQSIMNRESLDVTVSSIIKSGKTIEDVINDELSHLRLSSGIKLDAKRSSSNRSSTTASSTTTARSAEAPG